MSPLIYMSIFRLEYGYLLCKCFHSVNTTMNGSKENQQRKKKKIQLFFLPCQHIVSFGICQTSLGTLMHVCKYVHVQICTQITISLYVFSSSVLFVQVDFSILLLVMHS